MIIMEPIAMAVIIIGTSVLMFGLGFVAGRSH